MYVLDHTWQPFANLMKKHVYNVLLICSNYDRFMLEEDGRVEEELYKEYTELGLSTPPKITHTDSETEAIKMLKAFPYDLVITMLDFNTGKVESLAERIKNINSTLPVIVLAPSPDHRKVKALKEENSEYIDHIFYWQGNSSLFLAMIKLIEDKMNIDNDTAEAEVQVIILIEDSVRFTSYYLPEMYKSLISQNRISILEALNDWGKALRMRGRPKILLAKNGEEGMSYYKKYKKNVLGVITDVNYLYKGEKEKSGLKLAKEIRKCNKEVPILVQSTDKDVAEEAKSLGCEFLWKQSLTLLADLGTYFYNYYNFGPFIFIDPSTGEEIARADTMKRVQHILKDIPIESFIYHSKRNDFSRWMKAQSLYGLASMIRDINLNDSETPEETRDLLYTTIKEYRKNRTRGVIAKFSKDSFDDTLFFSRIGDGSLGGKGRGLAFIAYEMKSKGISENYPSIYLSIPRTVVITTSMFDAFMKSFDFDINQAEKVPDEEILELFLSKDVPEELEKDLVELLGVIENPISIRSSSLLEDSHSEPFAGVYQTCMIKNRGSFDERLKELKDAIRTVWASTYFKRAQEYLKVTNHSPEEEKMAVIIQQITGSEHGSYWYPNVSGVGRSINYYPVGDQKSEDGVGVLSFGLGKAVVEDGSSFRYCPAKPKKPSNSLDGGEGSTQDTFYALDLRQSFDPMNNIDNLVLLPLSEAEKYPKALKYIASTLDNNTGMLSESSFAEGPKLITFNGMLKYDMFPLASVVDTLLKMSSESMGCPVEIEIAINTERSGEKKPDFSLLQVRPIVQAYTQSDVNINDDEKEDSLIYATTVMGNGVVDDITDIVFIKPESFKPAEMIDMAKELGDINQKMEKEYVLIAAGRLGSTDRWLGIPCSWSDISKAKIIVETGLPELQVEPSQGTHFFQNVTSLGCIYLTINPMYKDGYWNLEKMRELEIVGETAHFAHVRSSIPFDIRANGMEKKAIITNKKEIVEWIEN